VQAAFATAATRGSAKTWSTDLPPTSWPDCALAGGPFKAQALKLSIIATGAP
jgi:hypothetical protein